MAGDSVLDRVRENATGIVSVLVTGIWLAALVTGQSWWLAALLVGYVALVPLTAVLFGDERDRARWWDGDATVPEQTGENAVREDPLDRLRDRYASGELTDEQFERKLEKLLETETLEDAADRQRARERERESERT